MLRVCFAIGILPVLLTCAPAATVLNENFNELTPALGATSAGAFTTINGTNVDIVGGNLFGSLCTGAESGNCIDLDGTGGNPQGQLRSTTQFAPGNYLLSFDLNGSQRGNTASSTVTFGNYSQTFSLDSGASAAITDRPVTLSSPDYLLFVSNTPGQVGNLLDNVVVSSPGSVATPEPSALLPLGMLTISLLGLAVRRVRSASRRAARGL